MAAASAILDMREPTVMPPSPASRDVLQAKVFAKAESAAASRDTMAQTVLRMLAAQVVAMAARLEDCAWLASVLATMDMVDQLARR